ncbi:MFS transporter [Sciscionella marina]|uniref:MFS transporter n=1 Tax=Sciscionella marina TaxID=508770 RepID=UPI00036C1513|nr:MFS transporter [Sciscionella marina]
MSESTIDRSSVDRKSLVKAFAASLSGTTLEYYDFAAYSVASATIFGPLFFPGDDPLASTMLAFSTYAVGYAARPLGGFVFGRLGDVLGRKRVLVLTLVLVGIATFLIGVLPTYATIGGAAPILLVVLRFAQGVGIGGEWGGAVLLSSEFGDPRKRGFWASAAQVGPPAGTLLANGALALVSALVTTEQFNDWGWRIAFLLSALLVGFGLWIRVKLEETPVFKAIQAKGERSAAPLRDVFRYEWRPLLAGILSRICPDVQYSLFTAFILTYLTQQLGLSRSVGLTAMLIASGVELFLIPAFGALSDRMNRRLLYLIGAIAAAALPFAFFPLIQGRSITWLIIGMIVALAIHASMYGPQAAFVTEQFSARLRYTGSSLAYTIAGVLGGAIAPLIFTALLSATGGWLAIALYLAGTAVLTVLGLALGRAPDPAETGA